MRKLFILALGAAFMVSTTTATFAMPQHNNQIAKTTDMPDYPDNDDNSGPYTDPEPTPDPGPDSTDSGDSWDGDSSGGGFDGGGSSDVLF